MSNKITFDIEFTVNSLVELIGRASISRMEAEKVEGLLDNIDTVIQLDELRGSIPMEIEQQKGNKRGKKKDQKEKIKEKEKQKQKSVKISEDNDFDEDGDDVDEEGEQLDDMMDIQPQSENDFNDYYDDQNDNENDNDDDEDDDILLGFGGKKITKRQRGELQIPIELPLKKSRKRNGKNEQQDQLKKLEKDQKRRQQMKRHIERQRMQTLNQILNQTGRKQRLRNEKQSKDKQSKENKTFRSLGDVPKITLTSNRDQEYVIVHNTTLFSDAMLAHPVVIPKPNCYRCNEKGKYKVNGGKMVCSLPCYKEHERQTPKMDIEV